MVYPTLLAAIGDVAHPTWRASSIWLVAAFTFASGAVVALRMRETQRRAVT